VINLAVILLSVLLQIAAAGFALRINRTAGRPLAWLLLSTGLALMAFRRLYVLVQLLEAGPPGQLLPNELLGLVISALMLSGVLLIQGIFKSKAAQAEGLEVARAQAKAVADKVTAVMAATPVPTWIAEDPLCHVIHGNPAAAALLRMSPQANHSQSAPPGEMPTHFHLLREGRELAADEMPMQRAAMHGEDIRDQALDLVFENGERRHLMAYATPLRDQSGAIYGAVCSMVDVTGARQAETALVKAHKMESLGLLAGGLAHDFNNIFQAMMSNLEMVRAMPPGSGQAGVHLDRLQTALDRASRLSRDILHCSGGDLRRPEPVDLSSVVRETLDRAGLAVTLELAPLLPRVMMDPLLMGRVVEGLVTNAQEACSAGASIRVRTSMREVTSQDFATGHWSEPVEPGLYAMLEVSDQGHGIDAATLPRIFDPFFSTRDMGRGLGLPAALGIVRGHRGGIQVESIPGVGSVFRVLLPSPESLDADPVTQLVSRSSRNLVLLVDDEAELRSVMAEMLQDWFGLDVVSASDGQEAMEVFSRRPEAFDLVILDATMPRMGGVEAFKAMRELRPDLPGVLCSGYALPASREQAVAQGFSDFLKKPFTSAELKGVLDRLLGSDF
jgi:signal transduction histidine kinase/ActR/RegA family two-component response regulator